jgi:hypothetical protein
MADKNAPASAAVPLATEAEVAELEQAQAAEWGTWVATQLITFNGVTAYLPGDPVPSSNVERHGYEKEGLVKKIDSKEGRQFIKDLHEANVAQQQAVVLPQVSLSVPVQE